MLLINSFHIIYDGGTVRGGEERSAGYTSEIRYRLRNEGGGTILG